MPRGFARRGLVKKLADLRLLALAIRAVERVDDVKNPDSVKRMKIVWAVVAVWWAAVKVPVWRMQAALAHASV